jgi:HlyD family secretion protein
MTRGRIGLILLTLLIAAGLVYGFSPKPVVVEMIAVERGAMAVSIEEEGKTRVRERYVISAPVTGHLRRIDLKVGDPVAAGQILAWIDPARTSALDPRSRAQAEATLAAAEAAQAAAEQGIVAARAQTRLASQELDRTLALRDSGFVSVQALDQTRARVDLTRASLEAAIQQGKVAAHDVQAARASLGQGSAAPAPGAAVPVPAPARGQILKLLHESEGALVAGQPLLEVGNPESLEVEVEVLSTSAVRITPGARVVLDRWGGDTPLAGVVRRIEPAAFTKVSALGVEEQRTRVIVDLGAPRETWARLGDGFRVEARFVVWEAADVVHIPTSALFRHAGGWAVFVPQAERARLRPVKIGQRTGLQAQVLEGLQAGEYVIAHPGDTLADGVRIKPRDNP